MSEYLSPHFTTTELGGDGQPAWVQDALRQTAQLLEQLRAVVGVPLKVTSGYRAGGVNESKGGVSNSYHLDGAGADFVTVGMSPFRAYGLITAAIQRGAVQVGEIGFYTADPHIHVGRPVRTERNDIWVKVGKTGADYRPATADTVAMLAGSPAGTAGDVVAVLGVLGALGLIWIAATTRGRANA